MAKKKDRAKRVTVTRPEIDAAIKHASKDKARYNLCSVHVDRRDGWTVIESTDGRRLLKIQRKEDAPDKYDEAISTAELTTASKFITGSAANPKTRDPEKLRSLALDVPGRQGKIKAHVLPPEESESDDADAMAVLRTVDGTFPDSDRVMLHVGRDTEKYCRVSINPQFLVDAGNALKSLCSDSRTSVVQLHLPHEGAGQKPIVITAEHPSNGTRAAVVIMPIRASQDIVGDPFPKDEAGRSEP